MIGCFYMSSDTFDAYTHLERLVYDSVREGAASKFIAIALVAKTKCIMDL